MKLFNIRDLLKMLVPDAYELALLKLQIRLIFLAGHVKLRGDRYLYKGKPVVRLNPVGRLIVVELYDAVFPETSLFSEEKVQSQQQPGPGKLCDSFNFKIGENCEEEFTNILDHIKSVNEHHVCRSYTYDAKIKEITNNNNNNLESA